MKPQIPDWLRHLLDRPVAIFGGGVSGKAAAGLVTALGGTSVVFDREAEQAERRSFGVVEAADYGLVVTSPGFPPAHEWIRAARSGGCEIIPELDLASLAWPGEIIAVTGTNGKTTISRLLAHALQHVGRDACVVGNVGTPFCDAARKGGRKDSVAVCEVSSFQAEALRFFEADASVWSNFAEDHLERHGSLEAYFRAKFNLVKRTRARRVFFGPDVMAYASGLGFELPVEGCVPVEEDKLDTRLAETPFSRRPQLENFLLVRTVWRHLGLTEKPLIDAVQTFRISAHRLARTDEVRGVGFWDDSKATNFHAAEAALAGFRDPVLWIAGGRSKGGDLGGFAARVAPRIRHAYLLGETAAELEKHLRAQAVPVQRCESMREAVMKAFAAASAGDNIVLSPGFASFDMFSGYDDRGRHFEAAVAEIAAAHRRPRHGKRSKNLNRPASVGPRLT